MPNQQITISVELYRHLDLSKDEGQSFDDYIRKLAGMEPRPRRPLKPKQYGVLGRPASEDHKKLAELAIGKGCFLKFDIVEPKKAADGSIIEISPASNAAALQALVRRVQNNTGFKFYVEATFRGLNVYRVG